MFNLVRQTLVSQWRGFVVLMFMFDILQILQIIYSIVVSSQLQLLDCPSLEVPYGCGRVELGLGRPR